MKKNLFFIAALASLTFVSCADDAFIGDSPTAEATAENDGAIKFGFNLQKATRADHVGADAATLLNNKFYVVAFNGNGASAAGMSQTFDNYLVGWTANTAGTTESNTSDWEYVGLTAPAWSNISGNKQTIKYWDYSKSQYDFIAWSPGAATAVTGTPSAGEVKITAPSKGDYDPTYTLTGARADLAKCYIADMVTAYKAGTDPKHLYQAEVPFSFRNLACKVRVALYETVPGYSVTGVKFYTAEQTGTGAQPIASGAPEDDVHLFTTGATAKDYFFTEGTYTVSFPTKGSTNVSESDYNKAHVSFSATGKDTKEDFDGLVLTGPEPGGHEATGTVYLGRSLPAASYANPNGAGSPYYKTMLPNEDGTVLELRVDYTLLATDGSGETIKVYGAKAYVPAIYAAWKPNYAYTYVFKISDNTNGWTSQVTTEPQGLYPITFDAVVVDAEEFKQSTITTVATPSITTYQKVHDVTKNEYSAGTEDIYDIYIQVMSDGALKTDLNGSGKSALYTLSSGTWTEADVMDALNIQASNTASSITGRNGLTLTNASFAYPTTIPGVDGNDIDLSSAGKAVSFDAATGTYAYVYYTGTDAADTYIYSAEALTSEPTGWPTGWYIDPNGTSSAPSTYANGTYYKRYTNNNKDYGVKIIKVQ